MSLQAMMKALECPRAGDGPQKVGCPVSWIISTPAGDEALVKFIQQADQSDHDDRDGENSPPVGFFRISAEKPGGNEAGTAEKIAKMQDFVEIRDRRSRHPARRHLAGA